MFAARYAKNFDEDVKKWRFMAIASFNVAVFIELLTLKYPHLFLLLAATANAGKNITFLLAAATRASINMRFAKNNNMGDISGKNVSQWTCSSLVGMGFGMVLSNIINISSLPQLVPTCMALSVVSLYYTYKSAIVLDEIHLNNGRANLLYTAYFASGDKKKIQSVAEVNSSESFLLPNALNMQRCKFIKFGSHEITSVLMGDGAEHFTNSVWLQL